MAEYDFPFVGPLLDQSKAKKQQDFPRLKKVENLRCTKAGALIPRKGTEQIATTSPDDPDWGPASSLQAVKVFSHDDQLLVADRKNLWTYSEAEDKLENQGDLPTIALDGTTVLGHYGSRDVWACTVARTTAFTCWVWVARASVLGVGNQMSLHCMTVDNITGAASPATLIKPSSVNEYTSESLYLRNVRAIPVNDEKVSIFWGDDSDTEESIYYVDITSATAGPFAVDYGNPDFNNLTINKLADNVAIFDNTQWLDVVPHGQGYLLAYRNKSGSVTVTRYNSAHSSQATANISVTGSNPKVQLVGDMTTNPSVTCAAVIVSSTHIKVALLNNALTVQGSPYNVEYEEDSAWDAHPVEIRSFAACKYPNQLSGHDGIVVAFNAYDSLRSRSYCQIHSYANNDEVGNGLSDELTNTYVTAKPWVHDEGTYVPVKYLGGAGNTHYAILRHETNSQRNPGYPQWNPEIRMLGGQANPFSEYEFGAGERYLDCGANIAVSSDDVLIPFVMVDRWSGSKGLKDQTARGVVTVLACNGYRFTLNPRDQFQVAKANGYTFLSGGTVMAYDGRRAAEIGFWSYPEISATAVNASIGNMQAGWYLYAAVWEWPDYLGNRDQSAYQILSPLQVASPNDGVEITLPSSIRQTYKQWRTFGSDARPISCILYRSTVSGTSESALEALLHRLEGVGVVSLMPETDRSRWNYSLGEFTDIARDSTSDLASRELIYSTGGAGELPNLPPPPSNIICQFDARLWMVDATDPRIVQYTKQYLPGQRPATHPSLQVQFPDDVVALVPLDSNLVGFTRGGSVYTVQSVPAGNTDPDGVEYLPPTLSSTERSCVNNRSIVSAPPGIFYESSRGVELMPRGQVENVWVGKSVRDELAQHPVITAAVHVQADSEVLFAIVDSDTAPTSGRVLSYNYDLQLWTVRSYQGRPVTSMCVHRGQLVLALWSETDGTVLWRESDEALSDPGNAHIDWLVETYGITLGPQGVRTNYIGKSHSLLSVQVQGEAGGNEIVRIEESTDDGLTFEGKDYRVKADKEASGVFRNHNVRRRRARAHSFRISGRQSTSPNTAGVSIYGLTLSGAPLKGQLLLARNQGG